MSLLWTLSLVTITASSLVAAFPQGAPAETCESLSPERGHGVSSQPVQYAPFSVIAYGRKYGSGDKIAVEIIQRERGVNFKGFLVQALDAETHQPIGQFIGGKGMQLLKECSAVTHTDAKQKKAVNLVWESPYDRSGEVIFRATIVQRRDLYYANILAFNAEQYPHLSGDTSSPSS
ncbi:putative defense protein 3 [Halotydeus destructor]|nr:putative defense protein 3 [Halotydeus destructor]